MSLLLRLKAATVCATILLSMLTGCSSKGVVYNDYTLIAVAPTVTARDDLPATLGVFPVSVPGWLDKGNITWSDGGVLLQSHENDHWGEPLPELLTQAMIKNLRRQSGSQTWVSPGPWAGNQRPAVVVLAEVQSITVKEQQLQVGVVWMLEGDKHQVIAQQEKVYALPDRAVSMPERIHTLSQVWGLVAEDVINVLAQNAHKLSP